MEIGSFSKYLRDLIVDHDKVEVPGLGIFYARMMPAHYSDNRTTIYPPYRTMFFRMEEVSAEGAALVYESLSELMTVPVDQVETELGWCISRLRSELEGNKLCILPGLGRMVANSANDFFFVPDEDADIYPDGLGLQPVCIKINEDETKPSRRSRKKEHKNDEPVNVVSQKPAEDAVRTSRRVSAGRAVLWCLVALLVLGVLFLLAMYLFRETFAPLSDAVVNGIDGLLNRMLYTEEERALLGF